MTSRHLSRSKSWRRPNRQRSGGRARTSRQHVRASRGRSWRTAYGHGDDMNAKCRSDPSQLRFHVSAVLVCGQALHDVRGGRRAQGLDRDVLQGLAWRPVPGPCPPGPAHIPSPPVRAVGPDLFARWPPHKRAFARSAKPSTRAQLLHSTARPPYFGLSAGPLPPWRSVRLRAADAQGGRRSVRGLSPPQLQRPGGEPFSPGP